MSHARIANRLWRSRKAAGLTQKQVAFLLGHKSTSQISRWERGRRVPRTIDLLKLSAIYHRLVNDLVWDLFDSLRHKVAKRQRMLENLQQKGRAGI